MNKNTLVTAVIGFLGSIAMSAANADTTTVAGGTVNFKGQVVNAACSVTADSQDQTVTLDQVRTSQLATAGKVSGQGKPFDIVLADCDTTVSTNASLTFNGQADATIPSALANNAGAGSATNVALQLYGPDGKVLGLGTESSKITLTDGTNTIPLSVDYIATADAATAGYVVASATFNVSYS